MTKRSRLKPSVADVSSPAPHSAFRTPHSKEGWQGWDTYAPFYDWENAQTLGRRDVPFWQRIAAKAGGTVLELGCGTGRVTVPLARAGVDVIGIDRSAPMLERAQQRVARARRASAIGRGPSAISHQPFFVRGDIRALPFAPQSVAMVLAPYGILQSLIRPRDLTAALASVARVIAPGATFGVDLVPDVPKWREYRNRVQLRGESNGARLTLVESVTQDARRHLTMFEQRISSGETARFASTASISRFARCRCRRCRASSNGPGSPSTRCSATTGDGPGTTAPTCGSSWRKGGKIRAYVWAFQMALH